tara:strand:- start:68 stop:250 length:183 start_codon:yes stop_codon:yes gene_type:complete
MKKSQVNPEELLKDLDKILSNLKLLEKENLKKKDISIIKRKIDKDSKGIKNKYKNLDSEK